MTRSDSRWRWDSMTAKEFPGAVRASGGVCIIPLGCIEKHGDHLPLGTDLMEAAGLAELAVETEPAVIFPGSIVAQIAEARHAPGTISFSHRLRWMHLEESISEIARNGFDKILILNCHGGNCDFLNYFAQARLEVQGGPQVFIGWPFIEAPELADILHDKNDGHAGECETSLMLALQPQLVRLDEASEPGVRQDTLPHLRSPGLYHALWWYDRYPQHYAGDGRLGTQAKGARLLDIYARRIRGMIQAIKSGSTLAGLQSRFDAAAARPCPPPQS